MDLHSELRNARKWAARSNESFEQSQERKQRRNNSLRERRETEVENVPELWTQHKDSLYEDFVHRYSVEIGPQYALAEMNVLLKAQGLSLEKLKLPLLNSAIDILHPFRYDAVQEQTKAHINIQKLNVEQKFVVNTVLCAIYGNQNNGPKHFFLDGPAGTGKTFVYVTLLHAIRGRGDLATPVASTGIAATLLSGNIILYYLYTL